VLPAKVINRNPSPGEVEYLTPTGCAVTYLLAGGNISEELIQAGLNKINMIK
jgi:hypothetical protein